MYRVVLVILKCTGTSEGIEGGGGGGLTYNFHFGGAFDVFWNDTYNLEYTTRTIWKKDWYAIVKSELVTVNFF